MTLRNPHSRRKILAVASFAALGSVLLNGRSLKAQTPTDYWKFAYSNYNSTSGGFNDLGSNNTSVATPSNPQSGNNYTLSANQAYAAGASGTSAGAATVYANSTGASSGFTTTLGHLGAGTAGSSWTYEFMYKYSSLPYRYGYLTSRASQAILMLNLGYNPTNKIQATVGGAAITWTGGTAGAFTPTANTWYDFAEVYNGSTLSLYATPYSSSATATTVTSNLIGTFSSTTLAATGSNLGISDCDGSKYGTVGAFDWVGVYNTALTTTQIAAHIVADSGLPTGPTGTTYTLGATATNNLIHVNGTSTITATITNTGASGADTLDYTNLTVSTTTGLSGTWPKAANGSPIANTNGTDTNTGTFTPASGGTYAFTPSVASATNHTLATGATLSGSATAATVQVYTGIGTWNVSTGGNWNVPSNWSDSSMIASAPAPGLAASFTGTDTATFGGSSGTPLTITLNASPSLNQLNFNGTTAYTINQSGGNSLALAGTTPGITVNGGGSVVNQTINAPVGLTNSATFTATASTDTLTVSGAISGGNGLTTAGGGTVILGGSNTYSGDTTVSNGNLLANSTLAPVAGQVTSSATGLGGITVNGGRLGGTGVVGNGTSNATATMYSIPVTGLVSGSAHSVNITSSQITGTGTGGIVSPGTDANFITDAVTVAGQIGTLTTGDQTWTGETAAGQTATSGQYYFKTTTGTGSIDSGNGLITAFGALNSGGAQDMLKIQGVLNIIGTSTNPFVINLVHPAGTPITGGTFVIANAYVIQENGTTVSSGTLPYPVTNDFIVEDNGTPTSGQFIVSVVADGSSNTSGLGGYDIEVVTPEPSSLGLLGIASLGLLRRRRAAVR